MRGCSHVCMIGTLIINYRVCVCVCACRKGINIIRQCKGGDSEDQLKLNT